MFQTSPELRKLQLKCLEILDVVDGICRKCNIDYSLCGGTVVGAYLYQGFIPWDDDIDLMMTRENYNRFLIACKHELPNDYEIQNYKITKNYSTLFTKVVDSNTTLVQNSKNNDKVINGVFLDITVYDKVPNNCLKRVDFFLSDLAQKMMYSDYRTKHGVVRWLQKHFSGTNGSKLYDCFEKIFKLIPKRTSYSYCELYGAFCTKKMYPKDIFENYTNIVFENKRYLIVRDYIDYLECRYERTDFYEPVEKQIPPHYDYVNFEMPYQRYQEEQR